MKVLDKAHLHTHHLTHRVVSEISLHARLCAAQAAAREGKKEEEKEEEEHVVGLYGFFEDARSVYLVLELCREGDLYR